MAIAVIAITAVALIGTILMSITSSARHRTLTLNDVYLKSYADAAQQQIQRQKNPLFQNCATSYSVTTPSNIPSTYTVGITQIQYWNGSTWVNNCPGTGTPPQLVTVAIQSPTQVAASISFAVRSPT